jgi:hypothetical protein
MVPSKKGFGWMENDAVLCHIAGSQSVSQKLIEARNWNYCSAMPSSGVFATMGNS